MRESFMRIITATVEEAEQIYNMVQHTIRTVYPKYYPKEVVDFFCELHSKENITKDIKNGCVVTLQEENDKGHLLGTGSYKDNHITRVYVEPEFQGKGYGSYIMQYLEEQIGIKYDAVYLDASLPASQLYENRGYKTVKHEKWPVANGVRLVYEVMEKMVNSMSVFT